MHDLLLEMHAAAQEWRHRGAPCVPAIEREEWVVRYFEILGAGFAAQPPPTPEAVPKLRGRQKQSAAKNLLVDLLRRADQVLVFLDDLRIPFTNNQAERDLRMVPRPAKDCRHLSQRSRRDGLLSHPQLSVDDAAQIGAKSRSFLLDLVLFLLIAFFGAEAALP